MAAVANGAIGQAVEVVVGVGFVARRVVVLDFAVAHCVEGVGLRLGVAIVDARQPVQVVVLIDLRAVGGSSNVDEIFVSVARIVQMPQIILKFSLQ